MNDRKKRFLRKRIELAIANNGRECGDCTACCTIMGVSELNKPFYQKCSHVCDKGCDIYKHRPGSCRQWSCAWRLGLAAPKPTECGLMIDPNPHEKIKGIYVYELWPYASVQQQDLLGEWCRKTKIVISPFSSDPWKTDDVPAILLIEVPNNFLEIYERTVNWTKKHQTSVTLEN